MQKSLKDNIRVINANSLNKNYWRDLFEYRELFFFLTWRDILVRYKQTIIGILWSVIRPVLTMIVFTVVFGKIANLPSEGDAPYALLVFAALLPWQMFANAVQESSNSLVNNADLISKVYFPRMIMPVSAVMTAVVDFMIAFCIYLLLMLYYGYSMSIQILFMPLFMIFALATAIGAGLFISALNVSYRDFRYIIPFIIQIGLFASPVGFSSSAIPEEWRLLYSINPMVGVIDGFRWCLLGMEVDFYWPGFILSLCVTLMLLFVGVKTFRSMERSFADKI
jgi:lipopolysaccharide transport system permease protein